MQSIRASEILSTLPPEAILPNVFGADSNCGLIVATNGSTKAFTNNFPQNVADWSDDHHLAARKTVALMIAASNDQLMAILYDVMDQTEVLDLLEQ